MQLDREFNIDSRKDGGTHGSAEITIWLRCVMNKAKILNDENGQFVAIAITERDLAWLVGTQEG